MSRDHASTMLKFISCLDLDSVDDNLYVGHSPDFGWRRIFGGQFIAQSIIAAQRTVAQDKSIHSLHSYFLRPGDPEVPIEYRVTRVRDGSSFCVRSIDAYQNERHVFTMMASLQKMEIGLEHYSEMPNVAMPELLDPTDMLVEAGENIIRPLKAYFDKERPFEFRPVSIERYTTDKVLEPHQSVWLKLVAPIDEAMHATYATAMLAYISDALLIDTALFPHATNIFDGSIQGASLDHAIWFHRPFKLDDWVLYHMESPSASASRGMARGQLYSRGGALIASVAQEGLIRQRPGAR